MTYEIEIICSYCGERLGTKLISESDFLTEIKAINGSLVSHSICQNCFKYAIKDIMNYKSKKMVDEQSPQYSHNSFIFFP